jgi:hypothetical protein
MPRNSGELVVQLCKLQRRFHRRSSKRAAQPQEGRLETGQQDAILPHFGSYSFHIGSEMPDDLRRSEATEPPYLINAICDSIIEP